MDIVIWVLQVLAGLAFLGAGILKSTQPIDRLAKQMGWVTRFPAAFVRFIGVAELLGGIGLILPAALKVLPWLTPVAAIALAIIMVGAVNDHIQHKEFNTIVPSIVLLILVVAIALGRFALVPIS
jgi:uncharacterized membrane protein